MEENFGLGVLQSIYVEYFWCPIPWVWFGVIQCTLQNFRFYDFQNATSPSFYQIPASTLYENIAYHGECRLLLSFRVIQCTLQNFQFYKFWNSAPLPFSSDSSKLHTRYPNHGAIQAITFFGDLPKIKQKYGILNLTQDHMQLEIQSAISLTIFIGLPIQTLWPHWLPQ